MKNYLPRNKHDIERVKQLKNLSREEILPFLPGLMEWIQDMNWPIANEVAALLLKYPIDIIPLIKDVLATNDPVWKYWCLEVLVKKLPGDIKKQLKNELVKIIVNPSEGEKMEELDETSLEILQTIDEDY
ncbi:DUF5071 domain-containing protein [Caldibacillus lycopersici]|uniref:DUF5071 domain-containing protein n=1 Tax=Perspicuibacillus lycopersici TaxID=1325689 RepID=A0AAE3IX58_9BACI|nr:DUF5071 domain-containing protein [Perspicuibacillus lycopersici]MCU9615006.1 DUF5071 domain-containing protein [Perspicuibacillus lycopersici]